MNKNRFTSAPWLANESFQRNTNQIQLRSSVFPIIELGGGAQSIAANTLTPIEWNEIIRQTDQPLNEWRGNFVGNYVWPHFVSAGIGSNPTRVVVNVSGYYQIFCVVTLQTANAASLQINVFSTELNGYIATYTSQGTSSLHHMINVTAFIPEKSYIFCSINSTVANTVNVLNDPSITTLNGVGPTPRLVITQIAQYYDTAVGKMARVRSTLTQASSTGVGLITQWNTAPAAGVSNSVDMGVYQDGGSTQYPGYASNNNARITLQYSGYYLFAAHIQQNAGTGAPASRTRIIYAVLSGSTVIASHSMGALVNVTRDFSISGSVEAFSGDYIQIYSLQDTGAAMNVNPQSFSVVYLGKP